MSSLHNEFKEELEEIIYIYLDCNLKESKELCDSIISQIKYDMRTSSEEGKNDEMS